MKIISYNIHTGTDKDKNRTLRQMAKYLKIQNCDIICLQEVLYSQYRMLKFYLQMDGSFAENVSDKQYGICISRPEGHAGTCGSHRKRAGRAPHAAPAAASLRQGRHRPRRQGWRRTGARLRGLCRRRAVPRRYRRKPDAHARQRRVHPRL